MNRNIKLKYSADGEIDCNQERIERRAITKRVSKMLNVGISLLAAQMNSNTDFSMDESLIDISLFLISLFGCESTCWIQDYMTAM